MIRRLSILALLPLTLGLLAFALPLQDGGRQGGRPEKSPLAKQMEVINGSMRTVGRGWEANGASPEMLSALADAEQAVLAAKALVPGMLAAMEDEAKKDEELMAFRIEMNALMRGMLDLEDALIAGDNGAVEKSLAALGDLKDAGHQRFKPARGR